MTAVGSKQGSNEINVACAGVTGDVTLTPTGSAGPSWQITAPAALPGTITSGTITLGSSATFAGTEKVAVFWTIAGVNYYRYDVTIAAGTAQTSFALTGGTGTALPSGAQAVVLAVNQDITDGVSMLGSNVQQLIATSSQPGLIEWLNVTPTQDRLSNLSGAAGAVDTWPGGSGWVGPPTGGAGANWTGGDTVVTLRCWNFATVTATMQIGAILS